jgi:hypothetical protein
MGWGHGTWLLRSELHELKHNYNLLLNTFANVGLLKLLRTAVARQRLEAILEGLCVDAVQHAHPAMCKTCVCTLRLIVAEWCDGAVEQVRTKSTPPPVARPRNSMQPHRTDRRCGNGARGWGGGNRRRQSCACRGGEHSPCSAWGATWLCAARLPASST